LADHAFSVVCRFEIMKKVLFVCIENSCRSQMAEALAHLLVADILDAASAGSQPSGRIDPLAIQVMAEIGYDLSTHRSKSLGEVSRGKFDYVITMGCGDECPFIPAEFHEDWDILDPKGKSPAAMRETRELIAGRIRDLADKVRGMIAKS
jgi:arsenate reductase (thioredoxin)